MIHFHTLQFGPRIFLAIVAAVLLCDTPGAGNASALAQGTANLPVAQGTPAALVKSIVVANREVSETNELKTQATITRGTQNDRIVLPLFLYKGDVIETFDDTKVTVLFLDDPVPGRDNEVIIYPNSKVGIGSSDSWWGRAWAKVKDAFTSQTRYARLSARGTEYELNVSKDQQRAVLTVIEGTVEVEEGKGMISGPGAGPSPTPEVETMTTSSHRFLLANFIFPITQTQFGRELKVPVGQITPQTFVYNVHSECHQPHRYEFRTSDSTAWFSMVGDKNFVVGPQATARETRTLQIDATGLAPALYQAHVYAICLDCGEEPGCSQAQLDWWYRITVGPPGPIDTATPTLTPTPSQENKSFLVNERKQLPINRQNDQVIEAPASDLQFVLNWTSDVLVTTQPTYSSQNLIPHFATTSERDQNFRTARERAVLSNKVGSHEMLGDVYSDWGQPAWALFAYEKELSRAGVTVQPPTLFIDQGEALRLIGQLDEAGKLSATDAQSPKAQNLLGNIALDRARIALNSGDAREANLHVEEAIRYYAAALSLPAVSQLQAGISTGTSTLKTNLAEANAVAGDLALQSSAAQDAKDRFAEAVRQLEPIQQASSIYPFPNTDLGVAYRGLGDAAVLSGDLKAAGDSYAKARRQHEQAIAAHQDFAEAYFNLGDLFDDLGDRENAKANYRLAIQARPEQPASYYPLAMLVKDEDPALAAALAAIYLKLERRVFLRGPKLDNAQKLADRKTIIRPPRIGEQIGIVPNVISQTQSDAQNAIAAAGFKVGKVESRVASGAAGVVLEQKPTAGIQVPRGSAIDLVIAKTAGNTGSDVPVPNVVGKPESQARAEIETLGLLVSEETKSSKKQPKDIVIEQKPEAPKQVKSGSTVKLIVSAGDLVEIPDVGGKDPDEARKKLTSDNKLTVGNIENRPDCKVNKVIAQDPPPSKNKVVQRGTAVNLVIGSLGENPVTIPTFADRNSAEAFIKENGLTLKKVRPEETDSSPEGTVLKQSPKAGSQFGRNCPVNVELTVAILVWVDIENYVGQPIDAVQQKLSAIEVHSTVSYQEDPNASPGTVLQQMPIGPTKVKHRSYISLVVAIPPKIEMVSVPPLCGLTLQQARELLGSPKVGLINTNQDLVDLPPNQPACGSVKEGQVMWQDPPANSKVPKGSRVKLAVVSIGEH